MIKNKYLQKAVNWLLLLLLPVTVVALWQISTTHGWVRRSILPPPEGILESAQMLAKQGLLLDDFLATLFRIIKGFLIGSLIGIVLGIIIGLSPVADRLSKILVAVFRPIPIIALIPILILWMGIGEGSKVTVIVLGTFWALMLNTISGIKSIDPKLLELCRMLRKGKAKTIFGVIIPSAFPSIYTGIRLAASSSLAMSITAEMLAAQKGIGYRIMYARNMALPGVMFVGIIELGLLGMIIDLLLLKGQDRILKYR